MTTLSWIMILSSLLLLILVLFLFRRKKFIWAIILLAIGAGAWYGFKEYTRSNKDLLYSLPDQRISAASLVKEFEINDSSANRKYLGKVIETDGIVKEVQKDEAGYYTVVLGETGKLSTVRCSMDTAHQQDASRLRVGSSAVMRGSCTGFNKDDMGLGSDVILNFCVIVSTK
jgi:hypothetical protein